MIPHREKGTESESWHTFAPQDAGVAVPWNEKTGQGTRSSLGGSGFPTVDPHRSRWLMYSRGEKKSLRDKGGWGEMMCVQERSRRLWTSGHPAGQRQQTCQGGAQGKTAGDSVSESLGKQVRRRGKGRKADALFTIVSPQLRIKVQKTTLRWVAWSNTGSRKEIRAPDGLYSTSRDSGQCYHLHTPTPARDEGSGSKKSQRERALQ